MEKNQPLSKKKNNYTDKRRVERVEVFNTSAQLNLSLSDRDDGLSIKGIVINLSSEGCCIIFRSELTPEIGSFIRISIGRQTNIPAQVRWLSQVEDGLYKMGLRYQL